MIISFLVFLAAFTAVGIASATHSQRTRQDYYLANGCISPWLVGLSAVATNNSGYMFIGVIGYTYSTGLASIWLMAGWICGDFIASGLIHHKLHQATAQTGQVSYAGVLSHWNNHNYIQLRRTIGLVSLLFLMAYASAQLLAGSKALHVLLDWPLWTGAVVGTICVIIYCFAGGIRASIWTDAAQSIVMLAAMSCLLFTATSELGGARAAVAQMNHINGFMDWFPDTALPGIAGAGLFALSWLFAGFSVIGQPHIMTRFMALNDNGSMRHARLWYYGFFVIFYCMATAVGLLSRLYLPDSRAFDPELALPYMAAELLSPGMTGLILAGIFAATMSTADSLVLSCSATATNDLPEKAITRNSLIKISTIVIALTALGLTFISHSSVFNLVIMSWAALASAFAPLLMVLAMGRQPSQIRSLIALAAGLATAIVWRQADLDDAVYEGLPGILTGLSILLPGGTKRRQNQHNI